MTRPATTGPATESSPPPGDGLEADALSEAETFNPWSVVRLVFDHLAAHGLHPVLGNSGDPGQPAAALLRALGVEPSHEGNRQVRATVQQQLAELRAAVLDQP